MGQTVGEVAHFLKIARASTAPVPVRRVVSDQVLSLLKPQRFGASLLLAFAFVALCVSAVGIYGTVAYAVSQRTTEIGIRMALGARARNVLSIVLIDTGVAVAIGTVAGLVGASVTSTLLRRLLFGVEPFDLIAFAAALGTLATTACAAAMIPSWRSVSIDPARAIRTST
jgi:ABC-type antimicrobial peptide transport system permease subunit